MVLGILGIMTGTVRHRHSRAGRRRVPYGQNYGSDLTSSWLIFSERGSQIGGPANQQARNSAGLGRGEHFVGMAVDLHVAPYPHDAAIAPDQNRCAKNTLEGSAIHGF